VTVFQGVSQRGPRGTRQTGDPQKITPAKLAYTLPQPSTIRNSSPCLPRLTSRCCPSSTTFGASQLG
jgi:hypothetical protein